MCEGATSSLLKLFYISTILEANGRKDKYKCNISPWIGESVAARIVVNLNGAVAMRHGGTALSSSSWL